MSYTITSIMGCEPGWYVEQEEDTACWRYYRVISLALCKDAGGNQLVLPLVASIDVGAEICPVGVLRFLPKYDEEEIWSNKQL